MMLKVPVTTLRDFILPHLLFQKIIMFFLLVKQMIVQGSLCQQVFLHCLPLQHSRGSDIKAPHSLKQQGCPAWEEGVRWGGLCNPSPLAAPGDALRGSTGGRLAPGRRPRKHSEPQAGFSGQFPLLPQPELYNFLLRSLFRVY